MLILGIVYDENGDAKNHRSLLKVFLNPILRCFGCCIGTLMETDGSFGGISFLKCDKKSLKYEKYELSKNDFLLKKRRLI